MADGRNLFSASDLVRWATELVTGAQRSTIVWPLMVVSLVIGVPALLLANFARSEVLEITDLAICVACLLSFIFSFCYLMFTDRESLRSERHDQVSRVLDIAEAKGNIVDIDPAALIDQPEPRQLTGPRRKK
jgi:hypothetical protein